MVTMKEIARETGVSVSTVSLVMNERDEGRVKPSIAERVREAAARLGYKVNPMARSLRTKRTRILGFVSEEVATTPYAGGIIMGAQDAARRLGYMMITVSTDGGADEEAQIAALKRYGVDGFLYAKMSNRVARVPDSLLDLPLAIVNASDAQGTIPSIEPDEFQIGFDATTRLIEAGCERIAYVGCADPMVAQTGRLAGYHAALDKHGIPFDKGLTVDVLNNGPALETVNDLFDRHSPDGIFCFNDARAWYVYECAARRGLRIGHDVSVVGVDNHRIFAETLEPQLTTVELPHYEMGYWAACKVIALIEGGLPEDFAMPDTTAALPSIDEPSPVRLHCALIEKNSVRA